MCPILSYQNIATLTPVYMTIRQALLSLLVNDQLVIHCNDSRHSCLMLIIV